jgi:hypothetical protein
MNKTYLMYVTDGGPFVKLHFMMIRLIGTIDEWAIPDRSLRCLTIQK